MALITAESTCAICQERFEPDEPLFATWGVFPVPHGLYRFCDAPMHWNCYAEWPHRLVFAAAYVQMWLESERNNPYWSKVWLDDNVFVTVNPDESIAEVDVRLCATGSSMRVDLADWETWLAGQRQCPAGEHSIETAALAAALPALQRHLPTAQAILSKIDKVAVAAKLARAAKREQEADRRRAAEQARLRAYNERCAALDIRSLACPYCPGTTLRFTDGKDSRKSYFQCLACGRTFGLDELA